MRITLFLGDAQRPAGRMIQVVAIGNEHVQAIVAAGKLDDDQNLVLALGGVGGGQSGAGQKLRHTRGQRQTAAFLATSLEQFAAVEHDRLHLSGELVFGKDHQRMQRIAQAMVPCGLFRRVFLEILDKPTFGRLRQITLQQQIDEETDLGRQVVAGM